MMNEHFYINDKGQKVATNCFAGINVEIVSTFKRIHLTCKDYLSEGKPEIRIETTLEDIERERSSFSTETADQYSDAKTTYIEMLLVYSKLSLCLLDYDILLMHGSCLAIDGN